MINLRKIRLSLILAATFLSASGSLLYAMDHSGEEPLTIPAHIRLETVTPHNEEENLNEKCALHASMSDDGKSFAPLSCIDIISKIDYLKKFLEDDTIEVKMDGSTLFFLKKENGLSSLMNHTTAQSTLDDMLNRYKNKKEQEDILGAKRIALEEYHNSLAPESEASEDQETLADHFQVSIQQATKRKEERDNELARLRALLAAKEAEAVAAEKDRQLKEEASRRQFEEDRMQMQKMFAETQAAVLKQQQEESARALADAQRQAEQAETQRQIAAAQAALAKQQQEAAAAQAALVRQQQEAQQTLILGHTPEKIVKNVKKEKRRFDKHLKKGKF